MSYLVVEFKYFRKWFSIWDTVPSGQNKCFCSYKKLISCHKNLFMKWIFFLYLPSQTIKKFFSSFSAIKLKNCIYLLLSLYQEMTWTRQLWGRKFLKGLLKTVIFPNYSGHKTNSLKKKNYYFTYATLKWILWGFT